LQTTSTSAATITNTKTVVPFTVTLPPTTTTISSPAGFTPAAAALTQAAQKRSPGPDRNHARDLNIEKRNVHVDTYCTTTVTDKTIWQTQTVFNGNTVTRTAPTQTNTVWTTKTVYQTNNIVAATTKTTHRPTTLTNIVTTTSTNFATFTPTTTIVPPASTYYAACAAPNLLDYTLTRASNATAGTPYTKVAITGLQNGSLNGRPVASVTNAYDCCAKCQSTTDCVGSSFMTTSKTCKLWVDNQCPKQSTEMLGFYNDVKYVGSTAPGDGYVVSNGKCGSWWFGGTADFDNGGA